MSGTRCLTLGGGGEKVPEAICSQMGSIECKQRWEGRRKKRELMTGRNDEKSVSNLKSGDHLPVGEEQEQVFRETIFHNYAQRIALES